MRGNEGTEAEGGNEGAESEGGNGVEADSAGPPGAPPRAFPAAPAEAPPEGAEATRRKPRPSPPPSPSFKARARPDLSRLPLLLPPADPKEHCEECGGLLSRGSPHASLELIIFQCLPPAEVFFM
mmetsp:Transcript_114394/g.255334  ORF Transcript_114394/g.255334 Transcript_114394/m.255334 type:complete len:125 (+) Transcript_114394:420-794(+)